MNASDTLLRLLDIQCPVIQAPMAGVSTPQLAAAVSSAGALGSIALGASKPDEARAMIHSTRALTDRPFNVNLFCHSPAVADPGREAAWLDHLAPLFAEFGAIPPASLSESYGTFLGDREMLGLLLNERPKVVSFHFGLPPAEWIRELREAGSVVLSCVTNSQEAELAVAAGVDALVVQGVEAGGHRGVFDPADDDEMGTFALIPLISGKYNLPVIAAGGIMDGKGIAAAFELGAAGVQMGTAFILCPESSANPRYRAALLTERARHTRITSAVSGRPARGMVNRLFSDVGHASAPEVPDYPIAYHAAKSLHAAAASAGCHDFAVQWAGQGAPLIREMPAAQLVETLMRECREIIGR